MVQFGRKHRDVLDPNIPRLPDTSTPLSLYRASGFFFGPDQTCLRETTIVAVEMLMSVMGSSLAALSGNMP